MKLFHPRTRLVAQASLIACLVWFTANLSPAQTVSKDANGEKIIKYDDGSWRYYEGGDSLLLESAQLEAPNTSTSTSTEKKRLNPDTIIYDYQLFTKYVAGAVRYETQMLDKVDEDNVKTFALEELIASRESQQKTEEISSLKAELESLKQRKQDDQRLLSYARSLIKKILKVGKQEKYRKLANIYVPGFSANTEISQEDSLKVNAKIEATATQSKIFASKGRTGSKKDNVKKQPPTEVEDDLLLDSFPGTLDAASDLALSEQESDKEGAVTGVETSEDPSIMIDSEPAVGAPLQLPQKEEGKEVTTELSELKDKNSAQKEEEETTVAPIELDTTILASESIPNITTADSTLSDTPINEPTIADQNAELKPITTEVVQQEKQENTTAPSSDLADGELGQSKDQHSPEEQEEREVLDQPDHQTSDQNETSQVERNQTRNDLVFTGVPQSIWFSPKSSTVPTYHCEYAFQGTDEFTNQQKKELQEELFFTYTDERLKPFLKDRDYVTCKGYLTSISGGFRYLTLLVSVASINATREYGNIRNGSLLNLKLLDDQTVSLFSQSESQGLQDPRSGDTIYKIRYPIDYQKEKILLKSGVDKVRIVWSSGYEDYEVFNVDFFLNQLSCLNSK